MWARPSCLIAFFRQPYRGASIKKLNYLGPELFKNFWPSLCVTVSNKDHGTHKLGRRQRAGRNPSSPANQSHMQLVHPSVQRQRALGLILSNLGVAGKAEWKWLILGQRKSYITALIHCAGPVQSTTSQFWMAPSASAAHLHFRKAKLHAYKIDFFN